MFYYWNFTSKREIDKIPNANLKAKAMELYKEYTKQAKPYKKKMIGGAFGVAALSIASLIGANIYAAKLQVDSSKIARYQARKLLEDPKAFVNYTPESRHCGGVDLMACEDNFLRLDTSNYDMELESLLATSSLSLDDIEALIMKLDNLIR